LEFNPITGIIKKGEPLQVEISFVMKMTTEVDINIGIELPSEKKHSFFELTAISELSPFLDCDEIEFENGTATKPIGDGAFGVVYRAKYRGQDVAVKMLKIQDMPDEMLDEFDREVDLLNKIRHKNIVQFIGASKATGKLAIVTEFIEMGSLSNYLLKSQTTLDYSLKLRIALDTAQAMHFLHENKILHRDLKPDNLLFVSKNSEDPIIVKLTDFGTSRAVSEKTSNQYTVGVGTPMYMSPEILSKQSYNKTSDVFSYGVLLWVLYHQKEPYSHLEHSWDVAKFVVEGNREKISKDCPKEFKELIEKCWSQDVNDRPSFSDIITILERIIPARKKTI